MFSHDVKGHTEAESDPERKGKDTDEEEEEELELLSWLSLPFPLDVPMSEPLSLLLGSMVRSPESALLDDDVSGEEPSFAKEKIDSPMDEDILGISRSEEDEVEVAEILGEQEEEEEEGEGRMSLESASESEESKPSSVMMTILWRCFWLLR